MSPLVEIIVKVPGELAEKAQLRFGESWTRIFQEIGCSGMSSRLIFEGFTDLPQCFADEVEDLA